MRLAPLALAALVVTLFGPLAAAGAGATSWRTDMTPTGITVLPGGDVMVVGGWFAEPHVQRFSPTGTLVASWNAAGTPDGAFDRATDIASDGRGSVYVAEWSRVRRFTETGVQSAVWPVQGPATVAVGPDGDVYLGTATGTERRSPDGTVRSRFTAVSGRIAVARDGTLYSAGGRRLSVFAPSGALIRTVFSEHSGSYYTGAAVTRDGRLWATDNRGELQQFAPGGNWLRRCAGPQGPIAVADDDSLYAGSGATVRHLSADGDGCAVAPLRIGAFNVVARSFPAARRPGGAASSFQVELREPARLAFRISRVISRQAARVGTIKAKGEPGRNMIEFSGWVKGRRLAPGFYSVVAQARDRHGRTSNTRRINFRVI